MTSPADWPDPPLVPARRVFFETHIRPMFRLVDVDHMLFKVNPAKTIDLTSYDEVVKKATAIYQRLLLNMPPKSAGGLWPAEWILLFKRWAKDGFAKLDRASATYRAVRSDDLVTLTATLHPPSVPNVWFERFSSVENPRVYELVLEPGTTAAEPIEEITEEFPDVAGVTTVVVHDAKGTHTVNIEDES